MFMRLIDGGTDRRIARAKTALRSCSAVKTTEVVYYLSTGNSSSYSVFQNKRIVYLVLHPSL